MAARPQRRVTDERRLARQPAVLVRGEVGFGKGSRARYSTDPSNHRQLPISVVVPRDAEDAVAAPRSAGSTAHRCSPSVPAPKAVLGHDAEQALLHRVGHELEVELPDRGWCGTAGAFGFERGDHNAVSTGAGERVLVPAVRAADAGTLILADGFSCREQIRPETDRQPLRLAEVLQRALPEGSAEHA